MAKKALITGITGQDGSYLAELLLSKGARLEVTNENGGTLLHSAAYYGNKAVLESLLAHGAKVNATDKNGRSALQVAKQPSIKELLRQHGADEQ